MSRRFHRHLRALPLFALLSCTLGANRDATPQHLHVIVQRLPQCDYGVGFERPLRVELLLRDEVVATTYHSGMYTGEASLNVPLHAPDALPGRYTIRFGQCPSLLTSPLEAVACETPEWTRRTRVRLTPAGMENPQVVEYYRVRATCLPTPEAQDDLSPGNDDEAL